MHEILFKTIEEVQENLNINATFELPQIKPYIQLSQLQHLPKYLGNDLLAELLAWYLDEPIDENNELIFLLPFVQKVLANFSFQLAAADLDVELTSSGFAVVQNQNLVPASTQRVNSFLSNREKLAYQWVEQLLKFLEENQDDYDSWVDSPAYTMNYELFINNARDFDQYVNIDESRLLFTKWWQTMKEIELLIIYPGISKELSEAIKEQVKDESLTPANELILPSIKRALANLTAGKMWKDEQMFLTGKNFLVEAKKIMDAAPNNYPLYKNSTSYIEDRTDYNIYDNDGGAFFLMGGGHSK